MKLSESEKKWGTRVAMAAAAIVVLSPIWIAVTSMTNWVQAAENKHDQIDQQQAELAEISRQNTVILGRLETDARVVRETKRANEQYRRCLSKQIPPRVCGEIVTGNRPTQSAPAAPPVSTGPPSP